MTVPTVERGFLLTVFCSIEMVGLSPADEVDSRLLHLPQKLAGVGGETFDVAALALGINGVESQRGLAAAADTGDDDQTMARDGDVHLFEIVLLGSADTDVIGFHALPLPCRQTNGIVHCHALTILGKPVISCQE